MLDKTHLKRPKDHSSCLNINNNHKKCFFYNTVTICFDLPRNIIDYIYLCFVLDGLAVTENNNEVENDK